MLLAQRLWVWVPVQQTPLQVRHRQLRPAAMARRPRALPAIILAGRRPEPSTTRTDPAIPADPAARADPADPVARVDPGAQADPGALVEPVTRADPVGLANPVTLADPVGRADLRADPVDLADLVTQKDPVARADPVAPAHGMGIPSVATSTGPRGETDPPLGDRVRRRGRTGADRSRRPGGNGWMAQSTTGATRKRPCGIAGSTSGASGSSGFGSRCNKACSHDARFAGW